MSRELGAENAAKESFIHQQKKQLDEQAATLLKISAALQTAGILVEK